MFYVYRRADSSSAFYLAKKLRGQRVRSLEGLSLGKDDFVVCWGEQWGSGKRILNGKAPIRMKFNDARILREAGVPTIEVRREKPRGEGWLGREDDHSRGSDLIEPTRRPDYYTRFEELRREYRVHMFRGLSIRAGHKVPRTDEGWRGQPHEWIRSWEAGWDLAYQGVTPAVRKVAREACKALGLDFGAVDVGERPDGGLVVLEVNRAPALDEGRTVYDYVDAIQTWAEEVG